jgi:outer membrane biogenesis lipoprotein LolB
MRFLTLAGLLLLMAGCTGLPPRPVPESAQQSWTLRQQELKQIDGWQLKGRVAIVNGVEA